MEDLLKSKGLYKIALGAKTAQTDDKKQVKWDNKNDSAHGLIGMSISPDLRFYLEGLDSPIKAWEKLNIVFGLKNENQAYQLENKLLTLDPSNFWFIEDFLSKFKSPRLLLKGCKVKKEDDGLVYGILAKLGLVYFVFVSTFHSTKEALLSAGSKYKAPSFDALCDSLIREQEKLLHLGLIKSANTSNKALVAQ